ncbi:MAG: diacylglycerol kinase [Chthonomonadaceae bacterium]|nr:diacylglycerol kinase [Chthonomonadaceae bacterium]
MNKKRHLLSGFNYAQEGIFHTFRSQPHMRFHFYTLVAVMLSGLLLNLDNRDMLVLVFAITLVIVTEMINTALEAVVDMMTEHYNPVAKIVKDVAAGAVLIAAMNAIIAGVLIFFGQQRLTEIKVRMQQNLPTDVTQVVVVGIVALALIVVISKLVSNTGSPWKGGIISGHSAVGFLLAMTIFFTAKNSVVAILAISLALLVAQSRVEAGIHSLREVVLGAVLAILLTSLVFRIMPFVRERWVSKSVTSAYFPSTEISVFVLKTRSMRHDEGDLFFGQS